MPISNDSKAPERQAVKAGIQTHVVKDGGSDTLPLLCTKLYHPSVTPELESRACLIDHLEINHEIPAQAPVTCCTASLP